MSVTSAGGRRRMFRPPALAEPAESSPVIEIHELTPPPAEPPSDPPAVGFHKYDALSIPLIPIELLLPTKENPRVIQDDEDMASLVASIETQALQGVPGGLLQPLLVRPHPTQGGKYEVRAGERRLFAAKRANQTHLPCYVRNLDDEEAMEVTIVENLERHELTSIEEARGINTLLQKGWDEQSIAGRLGMSASWVARTASLTKLLPEFQAWALNRRHPLFGIPVTLLQHIARLPAELQEFIRKEVERELGYERLPYFFRTVEDFDNYVNERFLMLLRNVPWKLDDVLLYPQGGHGAASCDRCMHRSERHPLLFDDEIDGGGKASTDRCLIRDCFQEKMRRCTAARVDAEHKKHGKVLVIDGSVHDKPGDQVRKAWPGVVGAGQVREVSASTAGAVRGVVVNGSGLGQAKWYLMGSERSARRQDRPAGPDGEPKPRPLKERRAELEARRKAWTIDAFREHLHELATGKARFEPADKAVWQCLALLHAFGTADRRDNVYEFSKPTSWKIFDQLVGDQASTEQLRERLYASVFHVWETRLNRSGTLDTIDVYFNDVRRMAEILRYDLEALRQRAEEAIAEPALWKNLNPDGSPKAVKTGPVASKKAETKPMLEGTPSIAIGKLSPKTRKSSKSGG